MTRSASLGVGEVALHGHLLVLAVLLGGVSDDLVVGVSFILHGDEVGRVRRIDSNRIGLEVLRGHDIEREGRDVGVRVLLTLSQVSDEGGDVLFELSQVHSDVVFIELGLLIVLLVCSDGELESGLVEFRDHAPDVVTDADHLVLNVADLALLSFDLISAIIDFLLEVALGLFLLLAGHGMDLSVALKLSLNVAVLLLDHIDFTIKHIHVVEKRDVLLFSFDECGDDFIDGGDTGGLLDLLEGILDDLDVTDVHVHQVLLLLVVVDDLVKTDLEENGGVSEIGHSVSALLAAHVLGA